MITYSTIETLKEDTSISNNVDPKALLPYINPAELMHVTPIIGVALDNELKSLIEISGLTGNNLTLVEDYIRPVSAYASWHDSSTFMHVKSTNKGLVHQTSDSSTTVDFATLKFYRQSIKDKMTFYEERLKNYLDDNKDLFPLYRSNDCDDDHGDYSNGIYLY